MEFISRRGVFHAGVYFTQSAQGSRGFVHANRKNGSRKAERMVHGKGERMVHAKRVKEQRMVQAKGERSFPQKAEDWFIQSALRSKE